MPFISSVRGSFGPQGRFSRKKPMGATSTGGTITTSGSYRIHTFVTGSQSGNTFTFTADGSGPIEYLIVAGGGGGGAWVGGGGGAGGLRYGTTTVPGEGNYSVVVGGGGKGAYNTGGYANLPGSNSAANGGDSSVFEIASAGGGRGGSWSADINPVTGTAGANGGGSGGGSGSCCPRGPGNQPETSPSQGNPGASVTAGNGLSGVASFQFDGYQTGGGGGAGAGATNQNGGAGLYNSISGSSVGYAGGGGAGAHNPNDNGSASANSSNNNGASAFGGSHGYAANDSVTPPILGNGRGGGGGGGGRNGSQPSYGGAGGSGIVVIRYTI